MKSVSNSAIVIGLMICIFSISSTNSATTIKPGGQISGTGSSNASSLKDMAKANEPSYAATILETPVRWLMSGIYFIWHYLIYDTATTAISAFLTPITLAFNAATFPIRLIFGPILSPITNFFGNQLRMVRDIIWWLLLESISYGSGATAETVSEAMKLALNGIIQFFTDIGLPIADSAEKLSLLTDQMANKRTKRAVSNPVNPANDTSTFGSGITSIISLPFTIAWRIFSIITYPIRLFFGMVTFPFTSLYGQIVREDSTLNLMLADMSIGNMANLALADIWYLLTTTIIPEMDVAANYFKQSQMLPQIIRNFLSGFDSIYRFMKMFGFVA